MRQLHRAVRELASLGTAQNVLGHANLRTTEVYMQVSERVQEVVNQLTSDLKSSYDAQAVATFDYCGGHDRDPRPTLPHW